MDSLSRRRFLQISAATIAATSATAGVARLAGRAAGEDVASSGVQKIPTFCDICFWKCGAIAYVEDGKLWKIEGNPADPLSRRPPLPARHRRRGRALRQRSAEGAAHPPQAARRRRVGAGDLGRGAQPRRGEDAGDQGEVRPGGGRPVLARPRRHLPQAHHQGLRIAEHRGPVLRAVPRPARRRVPPDVRRGGRLARAHRHPERALPRADRLAPRREHAQHAGAGIRRGDGRRARASSSSTRASPSPPARRSTTSRSSPARTSRSSWRGCTCS